MTSEEVNKVIAENKRLQEMISMLKGKISQLKEYAQKSQNDAKQYYVKANAYLKEKKMEWAKLVQEKTLRRMALHEFPASFSA